MSEVLTTEYKGIKVRSVIIDDAEWFVAKDIAEAIGYKSADKAYSRAKKDIILFREAMSHGLHPSTKVCNRDGLLSMISGSRIQPAEYLKGFIKTLLGGNVYVNITVRDELTSIKTIEQVLKVKLHRQYRVGKYRIDGYDKVNNIAYEIDEPYHSFQQEADAERQAYLEDQLGCTFVRIKL